MTSQRNLMDQQQDEAKLEGTVEIDINSNEENLIEQDNNEAIQIQEQKEQEETTVHETEKIETDIAQDTLISTTETIEVPLNPNEGEVLENPQVSNLGSSIADTAENDNNLKELKDNPATYSRNLITEETEEELETQEHAFKEYIASQTNLNAFGGDNNGIYFKPS